MNAIIFPVLERFLFSAVWVLKTGQLVGLMLTVAKAFVEEQKDRERRREKERKKEAFHEKSYIRNEKEWKMLKTMSIDWPKHIQWIPSMFYHMNKKGNVGMFDNVLIDNYLDLVRQCKNRSFLGLFRPIFCTCQW